MEDHIHALRFGDARITLKIARVVVVVFIGTELKRVHEHARDHAVASAARSFHERHMAFVERAHGRGEADREAFSFPCCNTCFHLGNSGDDFHGFPVFQNSDESNRTDRITNLLIQFIEHFFAHIFEAMLSGGEGVRLHFGIVIFERLGHLLTDVGEVLHELGLEIGEQREHVLID